MLFNIFKKKYKNNIKYKFKIGDKVIFTNSYGVCWGVKTIIKLDVVFTTRDEGLKEPVYHYKDSDTPWYPCPEKHLVLATKEDIKMSGPRYHNWDYFQNKYGFKDLITDTDGFS